MIDRTPAGPHTSASAQYVLPGAERATHKTLAERRWSAPKRPTASQRSPGGMFSDDAAQLDLIDHIRRQS